MTAKRAWILTDERINDLQVSTVSTLVQRAGAAHFCNVYLRINGRDEVYEADWLKHLKPAAWPDGLIERVKAAMQRIQDGHAPRRIPADPTDVDLVLGEVLCLLEGRDPPFWVQPDPRPDPLGEALNSGDGVYRP